MKTCLVTGGCGFIGSALVKHLYKKGWKITVVDNMTSGRVNDISSYCQNFIKNDFDNINVLSKIKIGFFDYIFHLAAIPSIQYSIDNPSSTTNNNITATVRLFEAAIGNVKKIIFSSSAVVYGNVYDCKLTEDLVKKPISPYAWQKSSIEEISKIFCNLYEIDIVCLRYFNVYGPGQSGSSPYSSVVSSWFNNIYEDTSIRFDGNGEQSRDMVYIDDVVVANELFANSKKRFFGDVYNVATGISITNCNILKHFNAHYRLSISYSKSKPGDIKYSCASIEKINKDLNFKPTISFDEGFQKTKEWWETITKKENNS